MQAYRTAEVKYNYKILIIKKLIFEKIRYAGFRNFGVRYSKFRHAFYDTYVEVAHFYLKQNLLELPK